MESGKEGNVWWKEVPSLVRAHVSVQRCESPANSIIQHSDTLCLPTAPRSVTFCRSHVKIRILNPDIENILIGRMYFLLKPNSIMQGV
jgi:hypothetical protein